LLEAFPSPFRNFALQHLDFRIDGVDFGIKMLQFFVQKLRVWLRFHRSSPLVYFHPAFLEQLALVLQKLAKLLSASPLIDELLLLFFGEHKQTSGIRPKGNDGLAAQRFPVWQTVPPTRSW
jgi:hypothetical protein